MPQIINCPQCQNPLRVPDTIAAGSMVKCPRCSTAFAVPGQLAAPTPPTPPAGEFTAGPRQSSAVPPPPAGFPRGLERDLSGVPRDPFGDRRGLEDLSTDYQVELGLYFSEGMQHYGPMFGKIIGFGCIIWGIQLVLQCMGVIPYIGVLFSLVHLGLYMFLFFAFWAGYTVVCLRQLRGEAWEFNDCFLGFQYYVPLLARHMLAVLIYFACLLPGIVVFIGLVVFLIAQAGPPPGGRPPGSPPPPPPDVGLVIAGLLAGFAVMLLGLVPFFYFWARLFMFVPYFVIDRGAGVIESIKANWAVTRGHGWGWTLVAFVLFTIWYLGTLPCGMGEPFTLPIFHLVLTAAYLRISRQDQSSGPL